MAEYIERESLNKAMDCITSDPNCPLFVATTIHQIIDEAPTADVRLERYGHWIPFGNNDVACSECNYAAPQDNIYVAPKRYKYCPYYGAKMSEKNEKGERNNV